MTITTKVINWTYSDTTVYLMFQAIATHGAYILVEVDRHVDLPKEIERLKHSIQTKPCHPF